MFQDGELCEAILTRVTFLHKEGWLATCPSTLDRVPSSQPLPPSPPPLGPTVVGPRTGMVVVSSRHLFVFNEKGGAAAGEGMLDLHRSYPWHQFRTVQLGLAMQSVQLHFSTGAFDLRIGDAELTWQLLQCLAKKPELATTSLLWADCDRLNALADKLDGVEYTHASSPVGRMADLLSIDPATRTHPNMLNERVRGVELFLAVQRLDSPARKTAGASGGAAAASSAAAEGPASSSTSTAAAAGATALSSSSSSALAAAGSGASRVGAVGGQRLWGVLLTKMALYLVVEEHAWLKPNGGGPTFAIVGEQETTDVKRIGLVDNGPSADPDFAICFWNEGLLLSFNDLSVQPFSSKNPPSPNPSDVEDGKMHWLLRGRSVHACGQLALRLGEMWRDSYTIDLPMSMGLSEAPTPTTSAPPSPTRRC